MSRPMINETTHQGSGGSIGCCHPDADPTAAGERSGRGSRAAAAPPAVDRATFDAAVAELRRREKAHTREGDAIAAARRRLPMVEVDAQAELIGPDGPTTLLAAFEGREQLIAYYFMWHHDQPAAGQCEGCTWFTNQVGDLVGLHSRDITFAVLAQGPYRRTCRYRDFMGWQLPWYSAEPSVQTLFAGRPVGMFHLVCYLRRGDRVYETYWTTGRGVEAMDYTLGLMDLTVYGRQEPWEDSPTGWPRRWPRDGFNWKIDGRPMSHWSRLSAGRSDDLDDADDLDGRTD